MRKAVIIVGSHFSGKSKTINEYFKPLVGLTKKQRNFDLQNQSGTILSQSIEEKKIGVVLSQSIEEKGILEVEKYLSIYLYKQCLVLAARPRNEAVSHLANICKILEKAGFNILTINVIANQPETFYKQKAQEAFDFFNS